MLYQILNKTLVLFHFLLLHANADSNADCLRHAVCLVIYQITVDDFASLFDCKPVNR